MKIKGFGKKGVVWETLIPWMIGIAVLIFVLILYMIISGRGTRAINYFKDVFRFGR